MDIPDITRYINSQDDSFKMQALVFLIQKLDKENSAPVYRRLMEVLYKASQSSSMFISEAACSYVKITAEKSLSKDATLMSVTSKDYFKKLDVVFTEILSRVKKAIHPIFLTQLCLELVDLQSTDISEDPDSSISFYQLV